MPDRGDLVWITLNPIAGHEQAGRRPVSHAELSEVVARIEALVVTPDA